MRRELWRGNFLLRRLLRSLRLPFAERRSPDDFSLRTIVFFETTHLQCRIYTVDSQHSYRAKLSSSEPFSAQSSARIEFASSLNQASASWFERRTYTSKQQRGSLQQTEILAFKELLVQSRSTHFIPLFSITNRNCF